MSARFFLTFGLVLAITVTVYAADNTPTASANNLIVNSPMSFTENAGQWDENIKFRASAGAATMWFGSDGAYYQFARELSDFETVDKSYKQGPGEFEVLMIKASFVGARSNPVVVGRDKLDYKCNYFLGNDPSRWHTDVANYESILYHNVYPGIDLKYFGNGSQLEYDFIVSPGADPSGIEVRYEGADGLYVNSLGELVVETRWGSVTELRPYVYQEDGSGRIEVVGSYRLLSPNSFGFSFDEGYDPSLPLIIDPVLTYSTYLGGSGSEYIWGLSVDKYGNSVVAGHTYSVDFPLLDPYQDTLMDEWDLFVTKFSASGNSLLFSTYLGGSGREENPRIAIDDNSSILIAGRTYSTDFPLVGPLDATLGGTNDAFVAKLTSSGSGLVYSTLLGGSVDEWLTGIAVDGYGNAYVTGITGSSNFPCANEVDGDLDGDSDAFVTRFNKLGDEMGFSTYLGGFKDDEASGIAVSRIGAIFVTGVTYSSDFPTLNAYDVTLDGTVDCFVTSFTSDKRPAADRISSIMSTTVSMGEIEINYSTYLGGNDDDYGTGIAIDIYRNAYVVGGTESDDFPVQNAFQPDFAGGGYIGNDVFLTRLSTEGNSLVYSTFLGGSDDDYAKGVAVDVNGDVYVTGATYSVDFPTVNRFDGILDGTVDAYITKFNGQNNQLIYSTFIGGNNSDVAQAIDVGGEAEVYIAGYTLSSDFPLVNQYQGTRLGTRDGFLTKVFGGCCVGMRGNFDGDIGDYIDGLDLVYLVDFMYKSGAYPPCSEEGDVDGDGSVSSLDLVYMIDYIYKSGPPPLACF